MRQVLELFIYQGYRGKSSVVVEASGVCTGALAAILASAFTSYDSAEFVSAAVSGFRVSFWIGLRASLHCRAVMGPDWEANSCVLSIFKTRNPQVENCLSELNSTLDASDMPLRLSAIFDEDSVSVTGPGRSLETLKSTIASLPEPGTCRWAHVHGFYHGGDNMKLVSDQVKNDIHGIEFPDWSVLHASLRSTATGQKFQANDKSVSLLRMAVENIFCDSVNWKLTWETATADYAEKIRHDTNATIRVIGIGPSAKSLLGVNKDKIRDTGIQVIGHLSEEIDMFVGDDIAIVGVSANFPGEKGLDGFWNTINNARSCATEIPGSRFKVSDYHQPNSGSLDSPRQMGSKHGNFLDNPFTFDTEYFNISPREAKSMDPQQRLLLHAAVEALDDAGYSPGATPSFQQASFGVYVGAATGDYVDNLRDEIDVYYSPGTLRAFMSGRISAHFLSPTGQCKPFDAEADGYCRAEGCALVVLKKLSQARAEGDQVYGIIRSIGVNQCGTAKSITHPDYKTQAELFSQTLHRSRLSSASIDVVEAHGTGTQAGDFAEVSSLSSVFKGRPADNPLHLGSVKGNIGHVEAASGIAGLIKLLLMMKHETIPGQGSFQTLNPRLTPLANEHNFVVPNSPRKWTRTKGHPRRALLNNFGAAGSNAALILEEAPREVSSTRIQTTAASPQRIVSKPSKTVFVFAGQGGAHEGMSAELLRTSSVFRNAVRECDTILRRHEFPTVESYLDPTPSAFSHGSLHERDGIILVQCACFVLQYALTQLLRSFGLTPDLVLGHSIGEYAALVTAEVLGLKDALLFVARRAELMVNHCEAGESGMLACRMSPPDASRFLDKRFAASTDDLVVACRNSPEDCVIAGPTARLVQVSEVLKAEGVKNKLLNVSYGFHSPVMNAITPSLRNVASSMAICRPSIQVGSSVLGQLIQGHEILKPDYFVNQTSQPVLFMELLADIQSNNSQTTLQVIEIGPSTSTSSMLKSSFTQIPYSYSPSLRPSESPWKTITSALQGLYQSGRDLNWNAVFRDESPRFLKEVPCQVLDGKEYVVRYHEPMSTNKPAKDVDSDLSSIGFELLASSTMTALKDGSSIFHVPIARFSKLIEAHAVGGVPLCPASVYLELALEALSVTNTTFNIPRWYSVHDVCFEHPLVFSKVRSDVVEVNVQSIGQIASLGSSRFSILNRDHGHLNCSGSISPMAEQVIEELFMLKSAYVRKQKAILFQLATSNTLETFSARTIYDVIFPRVVSYSEPFRTLKHLTISSFGLEGYGTFQLPDTPQSGKFVSPPPFVDTLLHAAGFIANARTDVKTACICVSLGRIVLPDMSKLQPGGQLDIYCSLLDVGDSILADAYVLDQNGHIVSFAEGMRFKKIRLSSFQAVLSRATQTEGKNGTESLLKQVEGLLRNPKPQNSSRLQVEVPPTPSESMAEVVKHMIQSVCGVSLHSSSSRTLTELGIDSLLFIELSQAIASRFPNLVVSTGEIERCQTVNDLIQLLAKAQGHDDVSMALPPSVLSGRLVPEGNNLPSPPTEPVGTDVASKVRDLFMDICGRSITADDKDASLASLGVDSLLSIELVHELRHRFRLDLEALQSTISNMSINNIEALYTANIASSSNNFQHSGEILVSLPGQSCDLAEPELLLREANDERGATDFFSHLIPSTFPQILQTSNSDIAPYKPSLYLFHDGSGLSSMYTRVKPLGRSVRGIFSPDIPAIDPTIQSMQELASRYIMQANLMSEKRPILCGWSFGGVLALEVSHQLQQRGNSPRGIILIDSPLPVEHESLPGEIISRVVRKLPSLHESEAAAKVRSCVEAQFRRHAGLLERYSPLPLRGDVPCVSIVCKKTIDTRALCGVSYPWLSDVGFRAAQLKGWERLLGREIPVLEIDCNHFEVFDARNIDEISLRLEKACAILDGVEE
ncbi:phenolpthiocerol synthesis polyketide synthase ppsA [Verticillium alfalfae VaMs.102]|uniref:Phenolpthiocerol synthesis polyketide synthase ppsA n=1 Tax=Verticillium alfalfae (strain VaMs.102 / ATCC MYA-4576 / FGSC 10136) TaxID=526221 RepID=C9SY26_VERA1|nr:phenolpthiocerol synthesis polyketide synthase ppsA [Verticillium alfalfae VaMs.102]EEY23691.1 phenolpthiocerol synthesis polyketide synthase ppsA [Verticillium alfalfae VaMs.102]